MEMLIAKGLIAVWVVVTIASIVQSQKNNNEELRNSRKYAEEC
jgi:hypothetical protein